MRSKNLPQGWDEARLRRVLEHYESQSDEEAAAEDNLAFESPEYATMRIPVDLVDEVRVLLARRETGRG